MEDKKITELMLQGVSEDNFKTEYKKTQILFLFFESSFPPMLGQFFDFDSDKLLDEKIKVLNDLKAGKTIDEIPEFYDILELYPKNDDPNIIKEALW